MDRPPNHEIDTLGDRQLASSLPAKWVLRDCERKDYGIDKEIEIFEAGATTGSLCKVQLKSTRNAKYSKDNQFAYFDLSVKHAEYYCRELKLPLCLVLADVSLGRTLWVFPQVSKDFQERLTAAREKGQGTIRVHIPVANELPREYGLEILSIVVDEGKGQAAILAPSLN